MLVAGTAIGAGVLAVPLLVADGGFFPSIIWYLVSCFFAVFSGYCVLEVTNWDKEKAGANFASLTKLSMGSVGKILFTSVYILFLYAILVAYFCEGGNLLFRVFGNAISSASFDGTGYRFIGPLLFFGLMFFFVSSGIKVADRFNRILVVGLILSFLLFCVLGFTDIRFDLLKHCSWESSLRGFPVLFLSFGYQLVIPSLFYYLDRSIKQVKKAIILGVTVPLGCYIIWNLLVLGVVPLDLLHHSLESGHTAAMALKLSLSSPAFYVAGECFAFFALTSSFIGVSVGFIDFLADELKWDKKCKKLQLLILIFGIPLSLSIIYPDLVLKCLHYGAGTGAALLTGIFPILMVWLGRGKRCSLGKQKVLPGGNFMLLILLVIVMFDLFIIGFK